MSLGTCNCKGRSQAKDRKDASQDDDHYKLKSLYDLIQDCREESFISKREILCSVK